MKQPRESISASGVSLLYEPDESHAAIVDIVFVHGLGGHPLRTWLYRDPPGPFSAKSPGGNSLRGLLRKNSFPGLSQSHSRSTSKLLMDTQSELDMTRERRVLRKNSNVKRIKPKGTMEGKENMEQRSYYSTSKLKLFLDTNVPLINDGDQKESEGKGEGEGEGEGVYWPLDLLPESCRNTRILTWGCQTLSTNQKLLPAQNDIFANADELLRDMTTYRDETNTLNRAVVFVAHSTGGVIVKEALRRSESGESHTKDLLQSTSAVIFIGCPHRASQYATLGDAVRSMAGATLNIEATDAVLQDLSGASRVELNLGRDAFVRLWNDYNFRVKTYQEMLGIPLKSLESKPDFAVRRLASFIGDIRENAESINSDHLEMCRFRSAQDVAYRSLAATISRFVHDEIGRLRQLSHKEQACARLIAPPRLVPRERGSIVSYPGTCLWLYDLAEFRGWHHRNDSSRNKILWVKGRPGSGKSVLLRSLRSRLEKQWAPLGSTFIQSPAHGDRLDSVFFPGGHRRHHQQHETSPAGVYRNLLAQLFRQDPRLRKAVVALCKRNSNTQQWQPRPQQQHLHHHHHPQHQQKKKLSRLITGGGVTGVIDQQAGQASQADVATAPPLRIQPRQPIQPIQPCQSNPTVPPVWSASSPGAVTWVPAVHTHHASHVSHASHASHSSAVHPACPAPPSPPILDDAQIVQFFADEYVDSHIETPTRRTFIFVDAADDCGVAYLQELLLHLSLLAQNSDFSICIASAYHPVLDLALPQNIAVEVVMHLRNVDDITRFVSLNLVAEWEDRNSTVLRIAHKSGGCFLWAEIVVNILNAAIDVGATQDLIDGTILEMPGDLDGLYEWLLSTLNAEEKAETLALFQWVILASEPMRLNDLRIAVRITKPWGAGEMRPYKALALDEPPSSLQDLRHSGPTGGEEDGSFDTPYQFHRWVRTRSIGLLELRPDTGDGSSVANEPLGLQRVHVIHESVRSFFLSGRGFACLEKDNETTLYSHSFSSEDLADLSHYVLLNACLTYLNMTDFECLGHGHGQGSTGGDSLPLAPMPYEETKYWRKNVRDQRRLVVSSYPFLQYAVDNLLFHMLSPRFFRYYLPQKDILKLFAANRCRLWRRWTALLGVGVCDPEGVLAICAEGTAQGLLDPVYGARYRLERVFRRVSKMAAAEGGAPQNKNHVAAAAVTAVASGMSRTKATAPAVAGTLVAGRGGVTAGLARGPAGPAGPTGPTAATTAGPDDKIDSPLVSSRIVSFTSTDVPSIFSPISPTSATTLLSPLSALEHSPLSAFESHPLYSPLYNFEASAYAAPKMTEGGYAVI